MDIEELQDELDGIFPGGFSLETDAKGQIIVFTGLTEGEDGELVAMDLDEEDDDFDPDFEPLEEEDDSDD